MPECVSASRADGMTQIRQKRLVCELIFIRSAPSRLICSEELHCGVNETRDEEKESLGALGRKYERRKPYQDFNEPLKAGSCHRFSPSTSLCLRSLSSK